MSDTNNVNLATPFANVTILEPNMSDMVTVTIALDSAAKGALIGTTGSYDAGTGVYTVTARGNEISSIIRALKFNPTDRTTDGIETTQFTITVTDAAGAPNLTPP